MINSVSTYIENTFNQLYSNYLDREQLINSLAELVKTNKDNKIKNLLDKSIGIAVKDIEIMISLLDSQAQDENTEYIIDNLKRKLDHLVKIQAGN